MPTPPEAYIYGLVCPIDKMIHYVGYSTQPEERYKSHLRPHNFAKGKALNPKNTWIKGLLDKGCKPQLVILEKIEWEYLYPRINGRAMFHIWRSPGGRNIESEWINLLLDRGHPLTSPAKTSAMPRYASTIIDGEERRAFSSQSA